MTYGRQDINEVIGCLKEHLGDIPMDGAVCSNRNYSKHLLDWAAKTFPDYEPVAIVNRLIDIAMGDDFHRRNCTTMGYIHRNKGRLMMIAKEKRDKEVAVSSPYKIIRKA